MRKTIYLTFEGVCGYCSRRRKEAEGSRASAAEVHLLTSVATANRNLRTRSERRHSLRVDVGFATENFHPGLGSGLINMKPILLFISLAALVLFGCGKRQPQADGAAANSASVPGDPAAAIRAKTVSRPTPEIQSRTANVIRESVVGVVEPAMTAQLQAFVAQNSRMPDNFAEFAHTKLDTVPRPPEGMTWVIDGVAMQVKAVPK